MPAAASCGFGAAQISARGLKVILAAISKGESLEKPPRCAAGTAACAPEVSPSPPSLDQGVPGEQGSPHPEQTRQQHQNAADGEQSRDLPPARVSGPGVRGESHLSVKRTVLLWSRGAGFAIRTTRAPGEAGPALGTSSCTSACN